MTLFTAEQLHRNHRCLDMALDVCRLIEQRMESEADGVHINEVVASLQPNFTAPIVKVRQDFIGEQIANILNEYGATVCLLWPIAHMLEHALYEKDLSNFR